LLPTAIGVGFLVFFALVIYWFLKTLSRPADHKQGGRELRYGLDFESAPEIMAYNTETAAELENHLKLVMVDDAWMACWSINKNFLEEKQAEEASSGQRGQEMVLRIYEAGDQLRYHDIQTRKLSGCCRLYLSKYRAYYVSLGIKRGKNFSPVLVSNTVIPNSLQ